MSLVSHRTPTGNKTWQQTKSENTRQTILDAAIACFHKLGYNNTTTEKVAKEAGVSRGAMLHHFPSRADLIKASVEHLNHKRIERYRSDETAVQSGAAHTRVDEGIDAFWNELNTPEFVVFHELQVAARTDPELRKVLLPALEAFDRTSLDTNRDLFPDLALSKEFMRAYNLTLYLLEGLAANQFTRKPGPVADDLIDWLKGELKRTFQDVLTSLDRESAKRRVNQ